MLKRADKIVVSSPGLLTHSILLKQHEKKIEIIPFGVRDLDFAIPDQREIRTRLLSVGRHVHYKGYDVLLKAIVDIECDLTIIGSGPLLEVHKQLAEDLGVSNKVEFKEGLDDTQVEQEILCTDVFVLPSRLPSEAFALVQIEALRAGKPVINTSLESGVPWVAKHENEALTVSPDSKQELRDAISSLLTDDAIYEKLSRGARQRYLKDFTLEKFLQKTESFYTSL
jgi:rhamnosyl/mannosyltransferase